MTMHSPQTKNIQLLLIRHGQSEADLLDVLEGRADFPLTELGQAQARKMADYMAGKYPPALILASPLKRASQTANILQESVGCKLKCDDELMEWHNGVLAGMSKEEAAIRYPLPEGGRPVHIPIEGGESELDLRYRAERVLRRVLHEYEGTSRIAIVAHGGLISSLIGAFLQLPVGDVVFATGDTGIHLLEVRGDARVIGFMNRQDHLAHPSH